MTLVTTYTLTGAVTRAPLASVGLVCNCGRAVAGMEGVPTTCKGCGAVYSVSVFVYREGSTTPEPPRDSGEADAVNGPTALGTQHDIGTEPSPLGSDQSRP